MTHKALLPVLLQFVLGYASAAERALATVSTEQLVIAAAVLLLFMRVVDLRIAQQRELAWRVGMFVFVVHALVAGFADQANFLVVLARSGLFGFLSYGVSRLLLGLLFVLSHLKRYTVTVQRCQPTAPDAADVLPPANRAELKVQVGNDDDLSTVYQETRPFSLSQLIGHTDTNPIVDKQ